MEPAYPAAMLRVTSLALLLPLVAAACGNDDAVDPNASKGWRAASTAMAGSDSKWNAEKQPDGTLSADISCPSGGSYHVDGSYTSNQDFSVTVTFDACKSDDVVIAGELALEASIDTDASGSRMHIDYTGSLHFSGAAVVASCDIDMVADLAVTGGSDQVDVDASFHGHVCGYSADAVVDASAHG